jgi:hypothetical protein
LGVTSISQCNIWTLIYREKNVENEVSDEDLSDQVWELWNAGLIYDDLAAMAWLKLATADRQRGSDDS